MSKKANFETEDSCSTNSDEAYGSKLSSLSSNENMKTTRPPDGGIRAYMVMVASFLVNGIIFGIINCYGVIYVHIKEKLGDDEDASTKASLVGSITVGATFLLSAVAGILTDMFGIRKTAFVGGLMATAGMLLSSFFTHKIEVLYFTYGILFGTGSALAYAPSLVILGHYFSRHLGLVNGIVTAGSSVFTIAMPHILEGLISSPLQLEGTLQVLSGLTSILLLASITFKPLIHHDNIRKDLINTANWRNKKYLVWALAVPSALFGYFVPYVHIVQYVKDVSPGVNGGTMVTCIAITSGLGRIIFGKVADCSKVNSIALQQISFVAIGICTMLLTAVEYSEESSRFYIFVTLSLIMGLFDGCFISLLGPIAFKIVGTAGASQAIGFLLSLCAIPLTTGPPIAGWLYDHMKRYDEAFLIAGVSPIVGAMVMFLIYKVKGAEKQPTSDNDPEDRLSVEEKLDNRLIESFTKTTLVNADDDEIESDNFL